MRLDSRGDGDGWVECDLGHRHWGLFGAAGLLLHRATTSGGEVLLQHRAHWSHHGGTWGLLGGARHSNESAVDAALREAGEEGGVSSVGVEVHGRYDESHGGWSYATVLAETDADIQARPTGGESLDVAWVAVDNVDDRPLHPAFAAAWPALRTALRPLTVVVDAANVVGSRPDGWWRDRAGAAGRLVDDCVGLAADGIAGPDLPDEVNRGGLSRCWPLIVMVVEGQARPVADSPTGSAAVRVLAARGAGDDAIVDATAAAAAAGPVIVVTADRELRSRVAAVGAVTIGPRWLTDRASPD